MHMEPSASFDMFMALWRPMRGTFIAIWRPDLFASSGHGKDLHLGLAQTMQLAGRALEGNPISVIGAIEQKDPAEAELLFFFPWVTAA
jgi:hypothetical protein